MDTRSKTLRTLKRLSGLVLAAATVMAGCNLSPNTPSEPTEEAPPTADSFLTPSGQQALTPTPPFPEIQPTNTPVTPLLISETLGPIAIDGTEHRTQESVTVRVRRGTAVSNITCTWKNEDNGQSSVLSELTETIIDESTVEKLYEFAPEVAGTYSVSCTGIALTASGQRAVSSTSIPFIVDAKG